MKTNYLIFFLPPFSVLQIELAICVLIESIIFLYLRALSFEKEKERESFLQDSDQACSHKWPRKRLSLSLSLPS